MLYSVILKNEEKKWQLKILIYQVPQEIKEVDLQNISLCMLFHLLFINFIL